jgi:hypothetical protein
VKVASVTGEKINISFSKVLVSSELFISEKGKFPEVEGKVLSH